jgi:hypothetical protein
MKEYDMDQITALTILINESDILPDKAKRNLLTKLPTSTKEEITHLGQFLAQEQKETYKLRTHLLRSTHKLLDTLDEATVQRLMNSTTSE